MTIQDLGAIGEFIGGILIIVTLIYLAIQTRMNAKVGYWQMYTDASDETGSFFMEFAKDPKLTQSWWQIQRADMDGLADEERRRCSLLFESFIIHAEGAFFMNTKFDEAPASTQERWEEIILDLIQREVAARLWERQKYSRTKEFQAFVEATKDHPA